MMKSRWSKDSAARERLNVNGYILMTDDFPQGLPGSSGSAGPPGKEGPAVSKLFRFEKKCLYLYYHICTDKCCQQDFMLSLPVLSSRDPLDKMAAPDPLAQLDQEASLETLASPDPRDLL